MMNTDETKTEYIEETCNILGCDFVIKKYAPENTNNTQNNELKFIDLFAGIGGIRLGFEKAGCKCVYSSEIDKHACLMYKKNFGDNPFCDITKLDPKKLPDFDILCAGFPCQAFSICGKQKGFYDKTRGTLFFDICRILEEKKPKAFMLENVFNLEKHDKGNTLSVMLDSLHSLGYSVYYKVLNARNFGVPQNRERIIIVGNNLGKFFDFDLLKTNTINSMVDFLDKNGNFEILPKSSFTIIDSNKIKIQKKSGLIFCGFRNKKIRTIGVRPGTEYLSRVHKQPNRIYDANGTHPTIASQESSGRYFIKVGNIVRKLTMNECFRFMGFPDDFKKCGSDALLYARIGNSVCVNMIESVAKEMINQIFRNKNMNNSDINTFLDNIYLKAINYDINSIGLKKTELDYLDCIANNEENYKGVFTVLFTSLVYKYLYPTQDVRLHQQKMKNGYSGRTFDTKYITPFLKKKNFFGAMKESGWLTRSLEQDHPYDFNYPGAISKKEVKDAFLHILDNIEKTENLAYKYLLVLINYSYKYKQKKTVKLINPILSQDDIVINQIMEYLHKHFEYKYNSRGASILPVIAIYSIYQCIVNEFKRFDNMHLDVLASHNSSDRSSGNTGDIIVRDINDNLYEVVEVKYKMKINVQMVKDAYKKICNTTVQRYYILSSEEIDENELVEINEVICEIRKEHGCQIIVNGLYPTIKYYLRLLESTNIFIANYIDNLQKNTDLNSEHKIAWNTIVNK